MPIDHILNALRIMNTRVAVRKCSEYDITKVSGLISDIYDACDGPEVSGKKVLLKPNILTDADPSRCVSTHPVVVEAMIRYLQLKGAFIRVGDSPSIHFPGFKGEKSGIYDVCRKTGAEWVDFLKNPSETALRNGRIKIARAVTETDLIISIPKFKNHELVYFTGAIKNTLGLVPGFSKAYQHALHRDRDRFSVFLVDLNEAVTPHFYLMDGIMGMEGRGPGQGIPRMTGILAGSPNPAALDIISSAIAGYRPMDIPTNRIAVARGQWLKNAGDIVYDGPDLDSLIISDFRRIPVNSNENISVKFLKNRFYLFRKFEKRPVFLHHNCSGCMDCIRICPVNAIEMHHEKEKWVVLNDRKCIRCYCCAEVCRYNAVEIRKKIFGV